MWTLSTCRAGQWGAACRRGRVPIAADDVTFVAVLRRGCTEHSLGGHSCVLAEHVGEWERGAHLVFRMSLLEATALQARSATFGEDGVMGRWKLIAPSSSGRGEDGVASGLVPSIKLVKEYEDARMFLQDAAAADNPEWVRRSYAPIVKLGA